MSMRQGTEERRESLFREAIELIEREYASDLDLNGVARRLATSRRQLQRAFAEAAGTSFRDELAGVRMRHARDLLADESIPVRSVAARVGYHQPAQFAKSFRRHHGMSPSTFRKREHGSDTDDGDGERAAA
jgi:AraC family transcriptional regulator, regulatory protein of adaptative response / methylphosphotriester-DNA alkyltransferase methyltransferase